MADGLEIVTERFVLRPVTEDDVTERYLGWLREPDAQKYIAAAVATRELGDLRCYVRQRIGREDVLFLAIRDKATGMHIGNIKYEPVNSELRYAIMGVLIGDPAWRGKGVTPEALRASGLWLKTHRNVSEILLGVSIDNVAAVRSYEKIGFGVADTQYIETPLPGAITMVWRP